MKSPLSSKIALALVSFFFYTMSFAQIVVEETKSAESSDSDPQRTPPPGLPIDSEIMLLVIGGVLLGVYFLYRNKKARLQS